MSALQLYRQSPLACRPLTVSMWEMLFLNRAPCDFWIDRKGTFQVLLPKNQKIARNTLEYLIKNGIYQLYFNRSDGETVKMAVENRLHQMSRALNAKSSFKNASQQMALMAINLDQLYRNPSDKNTLNLQYASAQSLVNFFFTNRDALPRLYRDFEQRKYHYTISHPLLSSILLASFLSFLDNFSDREIELLFLANYFKDIGQALIPRTILDLENPNSLQKELLAKHAQYSIDILRDRTPLPSHYLTIIGNHHQHSLIQQKGDTSSQNDFAEGAETALIEMIDMVSAMVSSRPYRPPMDIFSALNKVKILFADNYQQEFSCLVHFVQKFFSRTK